jgi:glycosyltransferase involved in cell wall biosynthesis
MNDPKCPLVTIITPTYNRERELPETIDSVLTQTYPNIEYIVVDDGSRDRTVELLRDYESRLRWVTHPNRGEARTVNRGWGMARGSFIATVNSDDPVFPEFIEKAVAFMQERPDVLVGYPDWVMIDEVGRKIRDVQTLEYDHASMLRWHLCFPGPGALMRRRVLDLAGFRNPQYRFVGDFEYWLRVSLHGPFARIPHTLARWRDHAGATTNQKVGQLAAEVPRMVEEFFRSPRVPPAVRAVEREARAAAHFIAGRQCLAAGAGWNARQYFLRSILLYPFSTHTPNGVDRSIPSLLAHTLLPTGLRRQMRNLVGRDKQAA